MVKINARTCYYETVRERETNFRSDRLISNIPEEYAVLGGSKAKIDNSWIIDNRLDQEPTKINRTSLLTLNDCRKEITFFFALQKEKKGAREQSIHPQVHKPEVRNVSSVRHSFKSSSTTPHNFHHISQRKG